MCAVLLPPGVNPIRVKYIPRISYHIIPYHSIFANNTSQHDFAAKQKIGYFNGNRCPESENYVSFFISRLVLAQFCFFFLVSTAVKM
jgi:hypothetical protein